MSKLIFSVHQINEYVRGLLNRDPILQEVWVRGEISNFKIHTSGHIYFTLKDERDKIRCVLFRQNRKGMDFLPSDGSKVVAKGQVSLYCRDGQYQLYVMALEKDGVGDLHIAFEAMKQRLKDEGLFDPTHKKPIPKFPKKIAVITSPTGAAVRDIIKVVQRRYPCAEILVIPVSVQGNTAPGQIETALDYANTRDDIDVIIVGRGGGSIEELWAFNEEIVARAIWRSMIPVISAVGHETDFTIADFVADMRAPTPSAAGEMVVPQVEHLREISSILRSRLEEAIDLIIYDKRRELEHMRESYVLRYPDRIMLQREQQLDQALTKLCTAFDNIIGNKREQLSKMAISLDALSPLGVLARGYAMVTLKHTKKTVHSLQLLKEGEDITIYLKDGWADCKIETINSKENWINE
jgi:exodeoxyribonuclease VII large subunit